MNLEIIGDIPPYQVRAGIVQLTFDRLSEDSKGDIRAEVEIRVNGDLGGHVFLGRVNLLSGQGKGQLSKAGESRYPFDQFNIDWGAIIEAACVGVIQRQRTGEPVWRLDEIPERESIGFRVEPYVVEGLPSLLYGEGGLGKSFLAVMIAVAVQEGYPTPVLENIEKGNVLYLDWEAEPTEIVNRARMIARGAEMDLDRDTPRFHYRFMTTSLANDRQRVARFVQDLGIDLVIVDSAGPACGGNPEAAEATLNFFQALRSLRCSSLILAHVSKGSDGRNGPFGSVYWTNMSRTVWEMRRAEQRAGSRGINVGLFHRKVNSGARYRSKAIAIEWIEIDQQQATTITPTRIETGSELAKGENLSDRISTAIREFGPMSAQDVWERLGGTDSGTTLNTVRNYLSTRNDFVRLPNTNAYGLASTRYQDSLIR